MNRLDINDALYVANQRRAARQTMSEDQIHEAKWWIFETLDMDCAEYFDSEVERILNEHYDGGCVQFLLDTQDLAS